MQYPLSIPPRNFFTLLRYELINASELAVPFLSLDTFSVRRTLFGFRLVVAFFEFILNTSVLVLIVLKGFLQFCSVCVYVCYKVISG